MRLLKESGNGHLHRRSVETTVLAETNSCPIEQKRQSCIEIVAPFNISMLFLRGVIYALSCVQSWVLPMSETSYTIPFSLYLYYAIQRRTYNGDVNKLIVSRQYDE